MKNQSTSSSDRESPLGDAETGEGAAPDKDSDDQSKWREIEQIWDDVSSASAPLQPDEERARHAERSDADRGDAASQGGDKVQERDFSIAVQRTRRSTAPLPLQDSERGPLGEQVRNLRTELLLRHGHRNSATLGFAVISTSSGEGRSLMAAELAKSFARLGRSTLLVDADMRRPCQHRIFGIELGRGLIQSIVEDQPPELNSIENLPGLSLLTAGSAQDFDPSELLSNVRFKRLMDSLRNIFEFIVVDTPPFNLHPDAQVVSAVVGRALTLHRSASSNYKETRSMLRSLSISNAEVIGGVLNRF